MLKLPIDNPYLSLFQYIQHGVSSKMQTVQYTMDELDSLAEGVPNKHAEARIKRIREIISEITSDGVLDPTRDSALNSSVILFKLASKLHEEPDITIDDSTTLSGS